MPSIETLAEYGLAGVCIALVLLVGFIINRVFKYMGNHMEHNTQALTKLVTKLDEDISAQKETSTTLRDLQTLIKK